MSGWKFIKKLGDQIGTRRVEIRQSPDGKLFRYYELQWCEAEGVLGDGYWSSNGMSGYFGSTDDCENEARNQISWLRP